MNKFTYTTVTSYNYTLYIGLKDRASGLIYDKKDALNVIQDYCDKNGLCVSVTDVDYIYTNGNEPGLALGFINYPRFPKADVSIKKDVITIAQLLMTQLSQIRASIVHKDSTIMITNTNLLPDE